MLCFVKPGSFWRYWGAVDPSQFGIVKIEARIPSDGGRQNTLWSVWMMHFSPLSMAKDSKGIQINSVLPSLRPPSSGVAKGRRQYCALKTGSTNKEKYCVFNQIWYYLLWGECKTDCSLQQVFKLGNRSRRSRNGLRNTWVDNVLRLWGKWNQRWSSAAGLELKGELLTIAVKMTAVDVQNPKLWHWEQAKRVTYLCYKTWVSVQDGRNVSTSRWCKLNVLRAVLEFSVNLAEDASPRALITSECKKESQRRIIVNKKTKAGGEIKGLDSRDTGEKVKGKGLPATTFFSGIVESSHICQLPLSYPGILAGKEISMGRRVSVELCWHD